MQAMAAKIGRDLSAQLADSPLDGITAKQNPQVLRPARRLHESLRKKAGTV
jgi:hypothetical protein